MKHEAGTRFVRGWQCLSGGAVGAEPRRAVLSRESDVHRSSLLWLLWARTGGWRVHPGGCGELSGGCDSSPRRDGGSWKEGGYSIVEAEKWADSGYI